jgi:hypothetical protein
MKVFISYPSERRALADALRLALEAESHEVFYDRTDLPAGEAYHRHIRDAVARADLMIFFVCPESVDAGYALTELGLAQARWPRPSGHVLPVVVAPVPLAQLPPYLQSVTLLHPQGDLVADTVAAVDRLARRGGGRRAWGIGLAAALLAALGLGALALQQQARQRAQAEAQAAAARDALGREVRSAAQLCDSPSPALAWTRFEALAASHPDDRAVRTAQEDCAMQWLRQMRAVGEKQTFAEQVDKVQPVLARALADASGARAGDLHAHIGWGEFLRWRDGAGAGDPIPHYRSALQADADNPYAHAMWAHRIAWWNGPEADMREHFDAALRSGRARAYVRSMQFSVAGNRYALTPYAVAVADTMRRGGESPTPEQRERLWRLWCEQGLQAPDYRQSLLAAVDPAGGLATYRGLLTLDDTPEARRPAWRLCDAVLLAHAGDGATARAGLQALLRDLGPERAQDRAARESAAMLKALGG